MILSATTMRRKVLSLSDKNGSYHFRTSQSTNKQGSGNLLRKTSPLIIKMWFKRNICRRSIYMGLIIREGGFLCRIVSQVRAEASSLDYVTFLVASPLLMPKAWQKQGISFVLPQKKYPKEKGPTTALVALPLGHSAKAAETRFAQTDTCFLTPRSVVPSASSLRSMTRFCETMLSQRPSLSISPFFFQAVRSESIGRKHVHPTDFP
jgi:hypothetical protein